MSRSKCARCGKLGHWARDCTNEPDERGRKRLQSGSKTWFNVAAPVALEDGDEIQVVPPPPPMVEPRPARATQETTTFYVDSGASHSATHVCGAQCTHTLDARSSFQFPVFSRSFPEKEISVDESFVGLSISPEYALVDTGAQHAVVGKAAFEGILGVLARFELQPRKVPTLQMLAAGIGGESRFLHSDEVPMAIQGVSGVVTTHCVSQNIPLLLPIDMCTKLGMILDLNTMRILNGKTSAGKVPCTELAVVGIWLSQFLSFQLTGGNAPMKIPIHLTGNLGYHVYHVKILNYRSRVAQAYQLWLTPSRPLRHLR